MIIYIILDVEGNVPQYTKPFVDTQAALTHYIDKAKKYNVKYDFSEVLKNPSAVNINNMRIIVTAFLDSQDHGNELHWIEESLSGTRYFGSPTSATVGRIINNLLNDLQSTTTDTILHNRIGFTIFLLQKYPFTDIEIESDAEWESFISNSSNINF